MDSSPTTLAAGDDQALRRSLLDAAPLLVAVALLMAGNGLTGTLLGVRAGLEGFGPAVTGIVLAGYYLGFLAGSLLTPATIRRVGHVRVFAGLASLASAVVLIHVVRPDPHPWFLLRALSGLCISGLYVVAETWLNGAVTNASRGMVLASYMVAVTGGLAIGQLFFSVADAAGFAAFVLASVLVSLAVVPVSLATVRAPQVAEPRLLRLREVLAAAPLGPVAAALSGFSGAAMLGAGTVYAVEAGLGRGGTATLLTASVVGGLVLQVPLGRWSDRTDRRRVVVAVGLLGALAAVGAALVGPDHPAALAPLTAVAGGMAFPLYSLSVAHLNDYLETESVVGAGARMIMVNGVGAVAGPIVGAAAVAGFGPGALFVVIATAHALVACFALWRMTRRAAVTEDERAHYVALPATAGPTIAMLQEGAAEELYPEQVGTVDVDGLTLRYRERGSGPPVILLPERGPGATPWFDTLTALAGDGVRAIAPDAGTVDAVLALLRDLELPEAAFVGFDGGHRTLQVLAGEHPDRVRAVVAGAPLDEGAGLPVLVLEDHELWQDDVERFADVVVDVLRHDVLAAAR